ncbi:hypothetical protein CYFUS_006598 [Cystobacter fuscus]|uniref:Prohead serine protease domain-containing protein n=2 Tax=Cystobacter fuscus TaxID=43 RepID=A0A250JDA7_9BACT|nr:hypothetical protein CYFUS_006598 [Cystobacter fuscus]
MKPRATLPADSVIKSLGHLVQKSEGGKPVFRISTQVLDRHRDRVRPNSLKTEAYEGNPVLLWNHDDCEPAVGTARVFREGDEWFMEPTFDEVDELSKTVSAKVKAGTLRTCSIRFRILRYEPNAEGGLDYEEVELLEVSIVNIPANPEAHRVKSQQPKQKNDTPPPAEETPAKALEPADLDAIKAAVAEVLQPVLEKLDALAAASSKSEGGEETDTDEAGDEEEKNEEGMEMTPEEAEEMKAFFNPTPKKK